MTPNLTPMQTIRSAILSAGGGTPHDDGRKTRLCAGLLLALVLLPLLSARAGAVDVNASDYVPAPGGTNLLLFYSQYATRSSYEGTSGPAISQDTGLDSYVNILRYVHYFEIAGITVAPQVLIPAGTLYDGRIAGVPLDAAAGLGDPIIATTFWVVNNKATQTYIGVMPYLFVPLGQYKAADALNMGENRWKLDLQVGWYQGLGSGFALQLTGDAMWYGDNTDAGGGGLVLTQDNTYQLQAWLSYSFAETWQAAIGYSKYWGGTEYLDGLATGNATQRDQVRLELSKFITPTFQVLGLIQRDFNTSGGFPEDFRGTVRLMQVF
ncbi:transporter [Xanthobacter autotrophicus]|uniref:transporter n=1 Tax=Xanthobacter TaxID=279 RepID=UPI0024AB824C|nr:transporter [Xanthobacter autotrophicus]MDI4663493.1 transporter [Xanthobacter autotrophicus]